MRQSVLHEFVCHARQDLTRRRYRWVPLIFAFRALLPRPDRRKHPWHLHLCGSVWTIQEVIFTAKKFLNSPSLEPARARNVRPIHAHLASGSLQSRAQQWKGWHHGIRAAVKGGGLVTFRGELPKGDDSASSQSGLADHWEERP